MGSTYPRSSAFIGGFVIAAMPTLTRWHIKAALAYFVAALVAGIALAARPALALPPLKSPRSSQPTSTCTALQAGAGWGWALALSAVLQWLAGIGFVVNAWGRVKPLGG